MALADRLDAWVAEGRGPALAAALAVAAALPGAVALPPLDRDEARFAQATAQMLESGDFVSIRFQNAPRFKKPVGIHWLQAAAVASLSRVQDRQIWAWRVPSLLGAMLAAAACVWGAAAFLPPRPAFAAGAMLAGGLLFSTEAAIAATDAVLTGAVTLMMAALARLYLAVREGPTASWRSKVLLWAGLILAVMVKGPIGPMILATTLIALSLWERRARWIASLGWGWGLIALIAVAGPWALAITVATDGAFWSGAVGGDLAAKLIGGRESHGAPPGFHAMALPLTLFPACLLLPAAAVIGWRRRGEPAVRFALCWLVPAWLVFEAAPTKLVHYTLPLFAALAWLMARALGEPFGRASRLVGAIFVGGVAIALAAAGPWAMVRLDDFSASGYAALAGLLYLLAGGTGSALLARGRAGRAVLTATMAAIAAHAVVAGLLAPALRPLWLAARAARGVKATGLSPALGVTPGPVTVAGFAEPSLVFLLGTNTRLGDANEAAAAIAEGRPAIVEGRQESLFRAALARRGVAATRAGEGAGLDYSNNQHDLLRIYRRAQPGASPP